MTIESATKPPMRKIAIAPSLTIACTVYSDPSRMIPVLIIRRDKRKPSTSTPGSLPPKMTLR